MDAAKYTEVIKAASQKETDVGHSLPNAMNAFDKEVFSRGQREIKISAQQGYAATHWEQYLDSPVLKYGHSDTAPKVER